MSDTAFPISIAADANHDPGTWPWLRLADTGETLNGKTIYAFGVHDLGTRQPMRSAVISCSSANNTIVAAGAAQSQALHVVGVRRHRLHGNLTRGH